MSDNTVRKQIKSGFRLAAAWLLGFAWLFLVFGGLAIITTPPPPSAILGWVLLSIAAVILVVTMDRWVRVFPGLLAYGIFGSILILVDGHALNHPEVLITRPEALVLIAFFAAGTILSFTFTKHRLTVPDRIGLFVFILCFFWQAVAPRLMIIALAIGFACLIGAWGCDRVRRRRPGDGSPRPNHVVA